MPRVRHVKSARHSKKERKCAVCGNEIQVGESYKYVRMRRGFAHRYTVMRFWCHEHNPGKYEFVSNEKTRALMEAEDELTKALAGDFDRLDAEDAFQAAADAVEEIAEMHRESAHNIEEGFGHPTEQSEDFEYRAEAVAAAAEELREAENEFPPEPDTEEPEEPDIPGWHGTEQATDEEQEEYEKARQEFEVDWGDYWADWEEWRDTIRELASEKMGEAQT